MPPEKIKKPRVLVLDTLVYQKLFDAMLGQEYDLIVTDEPGKALLIITAESPDLILVANGVGKTDGITVAKEMRQTAQCEAPILLLLTSDKPTLRREAMKAGCNGFLIKPLDPEKLKSQLDEWLKPQQK